MSIKSGPTTSKQLKIYKNSETQSSQFSPQIKSLDFSSLGSYRTTKFLCLVFLQFDMRLMKIHCGNNTQNDDFACPPLPFILSWGGRKRPEFLQWTQDLSTNCHPLFSLSLGHLTSTTISTFQHVVKNKPSSTKVNTGNSYQNIWKGVSPVLYSDLGLDTEIITFTQASLQWLCIVTHMSCSDYQGRPDCKTVLMEFNFKFPD